MKQASTRLYFARISCALGTVLLCRAMDSGHMTTCVAESGDIIGEDGAVLLENHCSHGVMTWSWVRFKLFEVASYCIPLWIEDRPTEWWNWKDKGCCRPCSEAKRSLRHRWPNLIDLGDSSSGSVHDRPSRECSLGLTSQFQYSALMPLMLWGSVKWSDVGSNSRVFLLCITSFRQYRDPGWSTISARHGCFLGLNGLILFCFKSRLRFWLKSFVWNDRFPPNWSLEPCTLQMACNHEPDCVWRMTGNHI